MTYTISPDTVVFEPDERAARKLDGDAHYQVYDEGEGGIAEASRINTPLDRLLQNRELRDRLLCGNCAAFMHMRRSPTGHERLVIVTLLSGHTENPVPVTRAFAVVMCPATPLEKAAVVGDELDSPIVTGWRVFAGQPDPTNKSHFTFDVERNGRRRTIDGWLLDDDQVKMEVRHR